MFSLASLCNTDALKGENFNTSLHLCCDSRRHRKNFRFPHWEIQVIFPKFGKKLWKKWDNISQIWENFGTLYSFLVPIEGFFGKKRSQYFQNLNLGKLWDFSQFWERNGTSFSFSGKILGKTLGIFCFENKHNCYFGKILGCVNTT